MTRRGAILMEMLIATAIFVAASLLTMQVLSNAYRALDQARKQQFSIDLARSKLAELEAGLVSISELQLGVVETVGSIDLYGDESFFLEEGIEEWLLIADTEPTEFEGLTLVDMRVHAGPTEEAPSVRLRQLVRLREGLEEAYEEDEILEDLPQGGGR